MAESQKDVSVVETDSPAEVDSEFLQSRIEDYERWFNTLDQQICALERERDRFSSLVKYTDAGVVLLDTEGRIVWTNEAFRERFIPAGTSRVDPIGQSCHQTLCRKKEPCSGCPRNPRSSIRSTPLQCPNGERNGLRKVGWVG